MGSNPYFTQGTTSEQTLVEDLIIESIGIYGETFYYIPRTVVGQDDILNEDRFSEYKNAYPIDLYFENVEGYEGQGVFMSKFGIMIEQSATLTCARRSWQKLIGKYKDQVQLPDRPADGDLLYFPLTDSLFEIKFVSGVDPFYQLRNLYVFRLNIQLFQYSSENVTTGKADIDIFEELKSFDPEINGEVDTVDNYGDNTSFEAEAIDNAFDVSNPFGGN